MKRPVTSARLCSISAGPPRGYTLVEILVATALALLLMAAVVRIFGQIGDSVSAARSTLEMSDRLRAAETTLKKDLEGVTVTMLPPRHPEFDEGYFEYIEGPVGPVIPIISTTVPPAEPDTLAVRPNPGSPPPNWLADTTVGDFDDILMFTTRSTGRPFLGRYFNSVTQCTLESPVAEVVWFVRGRTLYRRVMLVVPSYELSLPWNGFFANNDISVHPVFDASGNLGLVANTLGDLTKRECRYAHRVRQDMDFPFDAGRWGQMGLPTLRECSSPAWFNWDWQNIATVPSVTRATRIDLWTDPHPWPETDQPGNKTTGTLIGYEGPRIAEDVILTNVIGFDVKVWDPGMGEYVNLGYASGISNYTPGAEERFWHNGDPRSGLTRVYDTWSSHYEHDGIDQFQDGKVDTGTDGFDNDNANGVDDPGEMETSPPYPVPLRGIQIKIRVFEPDSRQIREVTVVQDFLPK